MNSIRIQGHFLATSAWHVSDGNNGNETEMMKTWLVCGAKTEDGRAPDVPPTIAHVPLVPSNSIRGRIHRHSLNIVVKALLERGEFLTKDAYQVMSNGGMIGGDGTDVTVGEILRARKHVHFGLWGGGPRMLPSTVVTCDLVPVCEETLAAGRVPAKFKDFAPMTNRTVGTGDNVTTERQIAKAKSLVGSRMFKRIDDMMQLDENSVQRLAVLGEGAEEIIGQHQAEQLNGREVRKGALAEQEGKDQRSLTDEDREKTKRTEVGNFLSMQVVSPGTVWPVDFALHASCNAAQIALFVRAVESFVNERSVGGYRRLGFGQYEAYLVITRDGEEIGRIRWNEAKSSHEAVFDEPGYDEALRDALSSITAAEINDFSAPKKPADDVGKKKPGKAKKGQADAGASE